MTGPLFGVDLPTSAAPGADPVALARTAERLGFDFVSASDHPCGPQPTYETWTMLTWVAAATTRVKVASRVLAVPLRAPAMVAKMAESLDRLSGGRLILGLGGGASDEELGAFGVGVRPPRDKVDGLQEAVRIIRGLWTQPEFSFTGRLYQLHRAQLTPRPAHRIPIWLGTFGDRALAVTGRHADGWIPSLALAPPGRVSGMRERVLAAARRAGRQPDELTCVYNLQVRVDEAAAPDPQAVAGPPGAVAERLAGLLALGFTGLNFLPTGPDTAEQVHRLATEVVPALRAAAG